MNINLAPGMNEIIIREGAAPKVLDPKAPVKMNINGTIGAPVEFFETDDVLDGSHHKLYIFLNQYAADESERSRIARNLN